MTGDIERRLHRASSTVRQDNEPPALEARAVTKIYQRFFGTGVVALEDLSVSIETGRIVALVGPNGAGKTTLLHLWMGFQRPTRGALRVRGIDVAEARARAGRQVAFVAQDVSVVRDLTPREHVEWAAFLRPGFDADAATGYIAAQEIDVPRPASRLSGGERTQLALALALGCRAPVVLLDEPFAHLDPVARLRSAGVLFDALRRDGATAVISSHHIADLERYCDWLVVLDRGRCRLNDATASLLDAYQVVADAVRDGTRHLELVGPNGSFRLTVPSGGAAPRPVPRPATLEEIVLAHLSHPEPGGPRGDAGGD
ncbi:MAG TPA: ABC transporter ATP-binding protein [Candidatus Binatia bacterium]|nr:ABC transporter ATP-binding protein [Candidatus Binatia bacterium]